MSFEIARRSYLATIVAFLIAILFSPNGAIAQSTITNPPIGEATSGDGRHRMFFDPAFNRHWAFVTTGAAIETHYADDQLDTWSAAGAAVNGSITDFALSFIRYNGESLVLLVWSDGDDVSYRRGAITDTTITWGSETEILNDSFEYVSPSVTITEAGHVWIGAVKKDPANLSARQLVALEATTLIDQTNLTFNTYEVGRTSDSLDRVAVVPYDLNHVYIVSNGPGQNIVVYKSTPGPVFTEVNQGGDEAWFTFPSGQLNGEVRAVALVGSILYAGGSFTDASGDENADYLARWNDVDSKWESLPERLNGEVWTLRGDATELFVGGDFTDAGGYSNADYAAVFNGAGFSPIGDGNITGGRVLAILRDGTRTYIGGRFTSVDGKPGTRGIAAFDVNAAMWISVDGGLQTSDNEVRVLHIANGDLFVGGDFEDLGHPDNDYIALYDGVDWQKAGKETFDLLNGPVNAIAGNSSYVFLGGEFTNGAGIGDADYLLRIDLSDLSWGYIWQEVLNGPVHSLLLRSNLLYLGGDFTLAGSTQMRRFAFTDINFGTNFFEVEAGSDGRISSMVDGSSLYLGGRFTRINQTQTNFVARFNDPGITSYGGGLSALSGTVRAATFYGGTLYVGGDFQDASGFADADYIARWNGSKFEPLPSSNGFPTDTVNALFADGSTLYVGGEFIDVGGNAQLAFVARYDGSQFSQLDNVSVSGSVNAFAKFQGDIVIGGAFNGVGGRISPRTTAYDPDTDQYIEMGDGFDGPVNVLLTSGDGSKVYAGGSFDQSGFVSMSRVAEWDGNSWSASGLIATHIDNGTVYALAEADGGLYIGGDFVNAGADPDQSYAIRLSAGNYAQLDGGMDGPVYSMFTRGGKIYAAGDFQTAGGVPARSFAYWDEQSSNWFETKGGVTGSLRTIIEDPVSGGLLIGGAFGTVGSGAGTVSNNLAILGLAGASDVGVSSPFSAASDDNDLHIFYRDSDSKLSHRQFVDGTGWGSVTQLSSAGSVDPFLAIDDSPSVLVAAWRDGPDIKYNLKVGPASWPGVPVTLAGTNDPLGISMGYSANVDDKFTLMWTEDEAGPLFVSKSQLIAPVGGPTYTISGTVTLGAQPLEDVQITASGVATTDTDSSGDYSFSGVAAGTNTTITPSLAGYTFSPGTRTISNLQADSTGNDFSASLNDYTISGIVKRLDGSRLSGVSVSTAGFPAATTDANGAYSITVPHLTSYSLSFTKDGYRFTNLPPSGQVNANNVSLGDVTGIERLSLSGRVVGPGGSGVAGIVISRGTLPNATTDPDGNFSFGDFDEGSSHTLSAVTDPDYRFEPSSIAVTLPPAQAVEFTATRLYEASGTITLDGVPLGGVTVQYSGNGSASDTSDAAGFYSFSPIDEGTNFTITPTLSGFDFDPSSTSKTADRDHTIDFTASIRVGTITGRVTSDGAGVEGVTVTLAKSGGDITSTTDASGRYTFTGIPTGTSYTVSASHPGYDIPGTGGGTLGSSAVHNFSATPRKFTVSGTVTVDGRPMEGVTIDGGTLGTKVSDASGAFEFTNVSYDADCVLNGALPGFEFPTPWRQTITGNVSNASLEGSSVLFPVLTCVRPEDGGAYTAFFGYRSDSALDLRVEVGPHNRFTPGEEDMGQVADFVAGPGTVSNAFSVLFDGKAITWRLAGGAATASKSSTRCSNSGGGTCSNGQKRDRCGICGGDGMSCLGCLLVDLTELHEDIVSGMRRYFMALRANSTSVRKARESGAATMSRLEGALDRLPLESMACSNTSYCSDVDRASDISEISEAANEAIASGTSLVRSLRRAGRVKEARRIARKSRRIAKRLRQDIKSLPRFESVCEE